MFGLFSWWPIARGLVLAFQQTNLIEPAHGVGFDNFTKVLADPLLLTAVRNTAWFAVLALVFGYPAPLALAGSSANCGAREGCSPYLPTSRSCCRLWSRSCSGGRLRRE